MRDFSFRRGSHCRLTKLEDRLTPALVLPSGFSESNITTSVFAGTQMEFAPDGKLFVLEQSGAIEVYQKNAGGTYVQVAPSNNFLSRVSNGANHITVNSSGERGLLGIAFDPDYANNRFVYIYYTTSTAPIHNRISRFTANAAGTRVVENSETILVDLDNLSSATNHNGGAMHFGLDGKLYVAVGENANSANSQLISNRHGKILRYNPDGSIPADNPTTISGIAGTLSGANRAIWAAGLRNPYTFSIHPVTGRMHINDVGAGTWEEINIGAVGKNYGWGSGTGANEGPFNQASFPNYTPPSVYYHHSNGTLSFGGNYTGSAITGGVYYHANSYQFPQAYLEDYFFPDLIGGWIRRWNYTTNTVSLFANPVSGSADAIVDMKVSPDGELFYLARDSYGSTTTLLYRIRYTGSTAPYIVIPPISRTVSEGYPATFSVTAGGPNISYQWQRNDMDIAGATSNTYTLNSAQLGDDGDTFRVTVTNASGNVTSSSATLTVTANQPPVPTINSPIVGTHFSYGDTINYSGSATDPEDGTITNGAQFTWRVDYHTGVIARPFIPDTSGSTSGSFMIPTISPYTEADVFYRIHLTVVDINGMPTTVTRDVLPNTVQLTLQSSPVGVPLSFEGAPQQTPFSTTGVVGLVRTISAPVATTLNGLAYSFVNWSDGGAASHTFSTPGTDTTYTATYVQRPAQLALFQVNDGNVQRSMVRSLQLTFDAILSPTTILNDAFSIIGPSGPVPFTTGPIDNSTGRSIIPITFTGPGLQNGSLAQGTYSLSVNGSQLIDSMGTQLDGDANGSPGGDYVTEFHRLFGDTDGNRTVNAVDFGAFRSVFGLSSQSTAFLDYLDQNGDGIINAVDFAAFRSVFGVMI